MIPKGYISLKRARLICILSPDIEGRIDAEIMSGGLKAYYYQDGERYDLAPAQWNAADKAHVFLFGKMQLDNGKREVDLILEERVFRKRFAEDLATEGFKITSDQLGKSKSNAGRKPKYDWDDVWIEIAYYVDLNGLPDTQADFINEVLLQCAERLGPENTPDDSTLKPKVSKLYERLKSMS
jgi:hypothetical protein